MITARRGFRVSGFRALRFLFARFGPADFRAPQVSKSAPSPLSKPALCGARQHGEPTWSLRALVEPHVSAWLAGASDAAARAQARVAMAQVEAEVAGYADEWGGTAETCQLRDERAAIARALHAVLCALDASEKDDVVLATWDALRGCGQAVSGFERAMPEYVGAFVLRHVSALKPHASRS